jgi:S-DNA-T family DNA segregation ATPase FtsK/SpoIIIE
VSSSVDSRIILDSSGAENLMGRGDAILKDDSRSLERFQVAYIDADEVIKYFGDRKAS